MHREQQLNDHQPSDAPAPRPQRRHEGETRAASGARGVPSSAGVAAATEFVARVAKLDFDDVRGFIRGWHRVVGTDAEAWFAAEAAIAAAVLRSGRQGEQRQLLVRVADVFTHAVWYRLARAGLTPESRIGATEASGQYAATLAMLALLTRDQLSERDFALVYAPFAALIPVEELGAAG